MVFWFIDDNTPGPFLLTENHTVCQRLTMEDCWYKGRGILSVLLVIKRFGHHHCWWSDSHLNTAKRELNLLVALFIRTMGFFSHNVCLSPVKCCNDDVTDKVCVTSARTCAATDEQTDRLSSVGSVSDTFLFAQNSVQLGTQLGD